MRPSMLLQTDGSEPNKLVIMNADVVKVVCHVYLWLQLYVLACNMCDI